MPRGPKEEPFPAVSRVRLRSLPAAANLVLNRRSGRVSPSVRCSASCRRRGHVAPEGGGSGRSGAISNHLTGPRRVWSPSAEEADTGNYLATSELSDEAVAAPGPGFIPSAAGERTCLGRSFAHLVLSTVLDALADVQLAGFPGPRGTTDPTNQLLRLITLCTGAREGGRSEAAASDGGRSPGRDGTAGGRVRSRPEERPGGGLLPAGGRAVHRDGRGRGIARPVGTPGAGHLVTRAVRAAGRAAGPDGGTDRPDAEAVARAAPQVGRRRVEHPDLGQCRARVRHQTGIPGPYRRAPPGRAGVRPHAHPGGERADRYRRGERGVFRSARRVRRAHRP